MKDSILALLKGLRWLVLLLAWLYTVTIAGAWVWRQTDLVNRAYALAGCELGRRQALHQMFLIDHGRLMGPANKAKVLAEVCDPAGLRPLVDAILKGGIGS